MRNILFMADTELRPYSSNWSVKAFDQGEADFIKGFSDSFLEKPSVNNTNKLSIFNGTHQMLRWLLSNSPPLV